MLPNNAIILCHSEEEAIELFSFLEERGARWDGGEKSLMKHLRTCHVYDGDPNKQLCYSLTDKVVGYCYERWYRNSGKYYENRFDPRFNYCTVEEFIKLCDGAPVKLNLDMMYELL